MNQVRAFGHEVDDCPMKYGGKQCIDLHDFPRSLPLQYKGALMYLPMRYPTLEEMANLDIVDMTSFMEWNPHQFETDEAQLELFDHDNSQFN